MKRKYAIEDKEVEIEEIEEVLAIKLKTTEKLDFKMDRIGKKIEASMVSEIKNEDWKAFENAGWNLVKPSSELNKSLKNGIPIEGTEQVQRVFRESSGRIFLGTNRLSVRLQPTLTGEEVHSLFDSNDLEIITRLKFAPNLYEVRVRPGNDFLQVSLDLSKDPNFIFAEPEFIEHIPQRFTPSDPSYGQQWHLNNTGQGGGTVGADISAEPAWEITRGAGTRVAIIDNGFDVTHPDLSTAIDPTSGFFNTNAAGNTSFNQNLAGYPDNDHGTFCAGMAIARANNSEGGCGVANLASFMAIACLGDQVGTQVTLARAVAYAADPTQEVNGANPSDGADVISCSLGPNGANWTMTATLRTAIDFAVTSGRDGLGTPIFWAVTNGNFQIQFDQVCAYQNTIAVGRSTRMDLEDNCGFGPELDFLATGVNVFSTGSGGVYRTDTGTSFAAPTAAGVGALILALKPGLTWQQVRQEMRDTCDKIGGPTVSYAPAGRNNDFGFGRINALKALTKGLWIAWKGSGNDNLNVMEFNFPATKKILSETSDNSPALIAFNSSFWIAWKGSGNDNLNVMDIFDPNSKITFDETSDSYPALTVFQEKLIIAWKGSGNDNLNVMEVFNPSNKIILNETSDTGPALTRNADLLEISWKGSGNDNLNFMHVFDANSKMILNETSDTGPAIMRFNSSFWISWKGSGNDNLNFMDIFVPASKVVLDDTSSHGPSLAAFSNILMNSWKGSGNDNLNVMDANNPHSKVILNETSDTAPSVAHSNPI